MNQTQRILHDLKLGLTVNMVKDIPRYGTSCRNRISDLRLSGTDIQDRIIGKGGAKEYFMSDYVKARKEIMINCGYQFYKIETIYKNKNNSYEFKGADLLKVCEDLKNGYSTIQF